MVGAMTTFTTEDRLNVEELYLEAERLADALEIPIAGKYVATDDIKKALKKTVNTDEIVKAILNELSKKPLHLTDLIESLNPGNDTEKLNVIRILLDAGTIKVNGEYYYL